MTGRLEVSIALADLAAGQWGLFTTAQARREGLSAQAVARLTSGGYLERLRHGVYRITGTPPGPRDSLQAAWLALQPGLTAGERLSGEPVEVVSHRSAAQLHQIGDVDADRLEFTTAERRQARDKDIKFHRGIITADERTLVDGLPVTTPLRTIVDLAHARLDGGHLAGVVRDAVTTLHLDTGQVAHALRPFAHHYGAPLGDGHALLVDLLQRAGIPESTRAAVDLSAPPEQRQTFDALLRALHNTQIPPGTLQAAAQVAQADMVRAPLSSAGLQAVQAAQAAQVPGLLEAVRVAQADMVRAPLSSAVLQAAQQALATNALRTAVAAQMADMIGASRAAQAAFGQVTRTQRPVRPSTPVQAGRGASPQLGNGHDQDTEA